MAQEAFTKFEEIIEDYAKKVINANLPCSTNEHIFTAQYNMIKNATGKIMVLGYDLPKPFYIENLRVINPVEFILINKDVIPNINKSNILYRESFVLDSKLLNRIKEENIKEFMITDSGWYFGRFKIKGNGLVQGIVNFNEPELNEWINRFELLKANSNRI